MKINLDENKLEYNGEEHKIFNNGKFMIHMDDYGYIQLVKDNDNIFIKDEDGKINISEEDAKDIIEDRVKSEGVDFW